MTPAFVPIQGAYLDPQRCPAERPHPRIQGDAATARYYGQVPFEHDVQSPIFDGKEGNPPVLEIVRWAVDGLKCNYLFWLRIKKTASFEKDILPTNERAGGRIVATPSDSATVSIQSEAVDRKQVYLP